MNKPGPTEHAMGKRIAWMRKERGLSLQHIADLCRSLGYSISAPGISAIEHGRQGIRVELLPTLAQAFNVKIGDLFYLTPPADDAIVRAGVAVQEAEKALASARWKFDLIVSAESRRELEATLADRGLPIEELELSVRTYHCLKRNGVDWVFQAAALSDQDLINMRQMGQKSVSELKAKLAAVASDAD